MTTCCPQCGSSIMSANGCPLHGNVDAAFQLGLGRLREDVKKPSTLPDEVTCAEINAGYRTLAIKVGNLDKFDHSIQTLEEVIVRGTVLPNQRAILSDICGILQALKRADRDTRPGVAAAVTEVVNRIRDKLDAMPVRATGEVKVTCDESSLEPGERAPNVFTLAIALPWLSTAKQARECGCTVPANVPDHAVYKWPGVFEWGTSVPTAEAEKP